MTKQDIIDHLTYDCGLLRSSAVRAVEGVINSITDSLVRGEAVTLRGFATIKPFDKAQKIGRDMNSDTPVIIPAHRTVKMVLSKELKSKLNPNLYGSLV